MMVRPGSLDQGWQSPTARSGALSKIRFVDTADVDHARVIFRRVYAESRLEVPLNQPFRWVMDLISCGPVKLTVGEVSASYRAFASAVTERPYIVALSGGGVGEVNAARGRHTIRPHISGAVLSPSLPLAIDVAPGFRGRNLIIERGALESHIVALTGRAPTEAITFDVSVDLESRSGATFYGVTQLFRREADQPDASPLLAAALRDALLTSLVTCIKHNASGLFEKSPQRIGPGYVKRAEEYIEAHATEPITLTQIAAAAGVPARSLRTAFTARHGVAPMEFLRRMRFELARRWLIDAPPGTTVMSVVKALGLGDPGRFSVQYKKRFGQSPSEALFVGRAGAGLAALRGVST